MASFCCEEASEGLGREGGREREGEREGGREREGGGGRGREKREHTWLCVNRRMLFTHPEVAAHRAEIRVDRRTRTC